MDAISSNAVNLGSMLSNVRPPVEASNTSDATAVSKVASCLFQRPTLKSPVKS